MNTNKEISISTLLKVLRKYLAYIVIVTILLAVLGGAYAGLLQDTTYTATAEFYIPNFQASTDYVSDSLLTASESLAEICKDLVKKNDIVTVFADDVDAKSFFETDDIGAVRTLTSMISSQTQGKGYLSVSVTSLDRDFALKVISSIQSNFPGRVADIVSGKGEGARYETTLIAVKTVTSVDQITENNPSVIKTAFILAALGFVASYCVFLIRFITDTLLHDLEDINENFDEPLLAVIPEYYTSEERKNIRKLGINRIQASDISKTRRQYKEKLLSRKTPFAVVESFNTLRTNLCYATAAEKCPVFAVTSDFSAAGKSIVSTNISISLASLGKKTLLVECDMRCPDFNRIFDTDVRSGLSELLSGNIDKKDEVVINTGYENFDIVFAGHVPPNPSELIGSNRMKALLNEWKEEYDYIILDMPPLIEVSDASIVASIVSGYMIVARPNHSDISAIASVTNDIKAVNGKIVGYVVNGVDLKLKNGRKYAKYSKYTRYNKYNKYNKYTVYSDNSQTSEDLEEE